MKKVCRNIRKMSKAALIREISALRRTVLEKDKLLNASLEIQNSLRNSREQLSRFLDIDDPSMIDRLDVDTYVDTKEVGTIPPISITLLKRVVGFTGVGHYKMEMHYDRKRVDSGLSDQQVHILVSEFRRLIETISARRMCKINWRGKDD